MEELLDIVERHWGYDGLWPLQDEVMRSVLQGRDSLVVLPTGGGKSLCFQAPAVAMDGMAVVVSPLISLMKDQVDSLDMCGVSAACINSSLSADERRDAHEAVRAGRLKLLYVAPERIVTPNFIDYLKQTPLSFIAIDEAHCISHWGHDFRPEYRELRVLRSAFPDLPIHAYTATATPAVRDDICQQLALEDPEVFVGSFDRPNLVYRTARRASKFDQVRGVVDRHRGESGIIYCITRKNVEALCSHLCGAGYAALPYHAGMSDEDRKANQEAFGRETADIIVATVAFGMGIDKSNVRYVIHAGMPKSIEHYQQESGRAGRDGLEAECPLFYSGSDFVTWRYLLRDLEGEAASIALSKLEDMYAYCTGVRCRHEAISSYFGQSLAKENCAACDLCLGDADLVDDALVIGQKILSCVIALGSFAGPSYTTLILSGSNEARVLEKGHDKLSTWGILADHDKREVRDWVEQLVAQGHLAKEGEYNILEVTDKGRELLRGGQTPRLLKPATKAKARKTSAAEARSWEGVDRELFELLRAKRLEIAHELNSPAFVVFGDAALRDMARRKPASEVAFLQVHGVGEKKSQAFADLFLPVIRDYIEAHGIEPGETPLQAADQDETAPRRKKGKRQKAKQAAYALFEEGHSIADAAERIGRALSTTEGYLVDYIAEHDVTDPGPWMDDTTFERVHEALEAVGDAKLKTVYEFLGEQVEYGTIRIAMACLQNTDVHET